MNQLIDFPLDSNVVQRKEGNRVVLYYDDKHYIEFKHEWGKAYPYVVTIRLGDFKQVIKSDIPPKYRDFFVVMGDTHIQLEYTENFRHTFNIRWYADTLETSFHSIGFGEKLTYDYLQRR